LDKAEQLYEVVDSDEGRARVACQRGKALFIQENLDDARAEFQRAAQLLPPAAGELQLAEILIEIGQIELLTGHPDAAAARLESAAVLARDAGDLGSLCHALTAQGARRYLMGDLAEAERMLREAVDLARQLENDPLLLSPLNNLAGVLAYQGRLDEAGALFAESSQLAERLGNASQAVLARLYLSDIQYQRGEMDQAIASYEAILEREEVGRVKRLTTWAHLGLAEIHERRGRLSDALDAATLALEIAREEGYRDIEGTALARRGQLLGDLVRTGEAMPEIELAEKIATAPGAGLNDLAARAMIARAVTRANAGDWRPALADAKSVDAMKGAGTPAILAESLSLACEGLLGTDRPAEAGATCKRAVGLARVPLAIRAEARALWAAALARSGEPGRAQDEALAALEAARAMDLWIPMARAAAVLVGLPADLPPERMGEIGDMGRTSLRSFLAAIPDADRDRVRRRDDLRDLEAALGAEDSREAAAED
jgi:tetratricopeptide (TPR) repeat protein